MSGALICRVYCARPETLGEEHLYETAFAEQAMESNELGLTTLSLRAYCLDNVVNCRLFGLDLASEFSYMCAIYDVCEASIGASQSKQSSPTWCLLVFDEML